MLTRKKGQATLEYVLIISAIVAAALVAATVFIRPRVTNSLDHVSQQMEDQVGRINFGATQ